MARFKRWTHGFVASIDNMIVQVENHEALATSALRELEHAVARSKVQLMRVERDGRAIKQALSEEQEAMTRWRERAKPVRWSVCVGASARRAEPKSSRRARSSMHASSNSSSATCRGSSAG